MAAPTMLLALSLYVACASTVWADVSIEGVVSGQRGAEVTPLAGAYVQARTDLSEQVVAQARTDVKGGYSLDNLPAGRLTLTVVAQGYYTLEAGNTASESITRSCAQPGDCERVDFLVSRSAVLDGWLTDDFGEPIESINLSLIRGGATLSIQPVPKTVYRATSDDRGYFRFWGVRPGSYTLAGPNDLRAFRAWRPQFSMEARKVEIGPGDEPRQVRLQMGERHDSSTSFGSQAKLPGSQPQPVGSDQTTVLKGRVISAQTESGLVGAKVTIVDDRGLAISTFSGVEGSFVIDNAPVGKHTIRALKSGYKDVQQGLLIPLDRSLGQIDVRINALGVIAGRVLDEDKRPVVGAEVRALKEELIEGRLRFRDKGLGTSRRPLRTDDQGVYRIFGLPAGKYVVSARPKQEPSVLGELRFAKSAAYYPKAESVDSAAIVELKWGEKRSMIDIRLASAQQTRAEGQVVKGTHYDTCFVTLYGDDGKARPRLGQTTTDEKGQFSVVGLPVGRYLVRVTAFKWPTKEGFLGHQLFSISESEAERITVEAHGPRRIAGRLALRGATDSVTGQESGPWLARLRIQPDAFSKAEPIARNSADVKGTGPEAAFELSAFPGRYRIDLSAPANGYIDNVEFAGRPIPGPFLTIPPMGAAGELLINVGFKSGIVRGSVVSGTGAATARSAGLLPRGVEVWLLPTGKNTGFHDKFTGRVHEAGTFEIVGVPQGEYVAFAVPDNPGFDVEAPQHRERMASFGKRLEVIPGDVVAVTLRALPIRE